jgi:hypothetical protein
MENATKQPFTRGQTLFSCFKFEKKIILLVHSGDKIFEEYLLSWLAQTVKVKNFLSVTNG